MSNANDSAYPFTGEPVPGAQMGLSKRELFAAMAMIGCMSLPLSEDEEGARLQMRRIASDCVFAAEALLAELAKEAK